MFFCELKDNDFKIVVYCFVIVNCPEGYYLDNNECLPCDIGQYTDEEKQTTCKQCPVDMTTGSLASTNISQCYSLCDVGHYYESISSNCIKCNIGEYQDQSGQTQCKSCPIGETTKDIGSTSITDYLCKLGEELSVTGECVKCPKGSYRDDLDQEYCQACPYGWSTSDVGSTSISQCTVAHCQRGEYLNEDNTCELCEKGTYQPNRGQTSCIACGRGLTTSDKGSTSHDDCRPGPIDECRLDLDDCDDDAECLDEEDGFSCVCNFGFTGNLNGSVCIDNCDNRCDIHGQCHYYNNGNSFCSCQDGYQGDRCDQIEGKLTLYKEYFFVKNFIHFSFIIYCLFCKSFPK
ncbi:hypothetical protein LOTGIDRAFT_119662 [Lottia gigantea]|uniref:EGF-like domain-containing protein n=1 Tax=Lottia gigantea TaxID=225164 RepID=V4A9H7_LOTGI|nr:hypothetical protein LOTGIDRAFT_119662 [Lottia gigantea]ESO93387.1 hypothetical protein LOTGIDRAFT_119662 [Lottia gigantea]